MDDEDPRLKMPPIMIPNPRNIVEYAQNVRSYFQKIVFPLSDGIVEISKDMKRIEEPYTAWLRSEFEIEKLKRSMANVSMIMPLMRVQYEKQIQELKANQPPGPTLQDQGRVLELILEFYSQASDLNRQMEIFLAKLNEDTTEHIRACVDCKTRENLTHQEKSDAMQVYCETCATKY